MTLNLAHLTALRELGRLGTMVAVADELGYTPGAVSQQIAALEKSVGTSLITKVGRNVMLTDAGVVLAEHADRVLAAERSAVDAVLNLEGQVAAPVVLGAFGSTAAILLPEVVSVADSLYPQMRLSSCELDVDQAIDAVAHNRVDLAFGIDYPTHPLPRVPGVEILTLREERFGLAAATGAHGVRTRSTIDLHDAADWPWILAPATTYYGLAMRIACRQNGFEPRVVHEIVDTAVTLTLVGKSLGVAPMTDMMVGLVPSAPIVRLDLRQQILRRVVLIRSIHADARPAVRAATEVVRTVFHGVQNYR
ncbi:LysR family transcriptional regulator [Gordonia sp. CPCC 205515]|uniref:LysR family transcriptional regulator n=1 Tax=Gordonia sp. CPCC 205515 TaxID=3140791 RepID=UPI003AF39A14